MKIHFSLWTRLEVFKSTFFLQAMVSWLTLSYSEVNHLELLGLWVFSRVISHPNPQRSPWAAHAEVGDSGKNEFEVLRRQCHVTFQCVLRPDRPVREHLQIYIIGGSRNDCSERGVLGFYCWKVAQAPLKISHSASFLLPAKLLMLFYFRLFNIQSNKFPKI